MRVCFVPSTFVTLYWLCIALTSTRAIGVTEKSTL